MADSKLNSLTQRQKKDMRSVVNAWKRSGAATQVLEEGLRLLSSEKRPTANEISKWDTEVMAVTCTWGKGYRNKLTLSKADASLLLELVSQIRSAADGEENAKKMVGLASGLFFDGEKPPKTLRDPSWEPLLRIVREVAPSLCQATMF
jgi:hypothetical protein